MITALKRNFIRFVAICLSLSFFFLGSFFALAAEESSSELEQEIQSVTVISENVPDITVGAQFKIDANAAEGRVNSTTAVVASSAEADEAMLALSGQLPPLPSNQVTLVVFNSNSGDYMALSSTSGYTFNPTTVRVHRLGDQICRYRCSYPYNTWVLLDPYYADYGTPVYNLFPLYNQTNTSELLCEIQSDYTQARYLGDLYEEEPAPDIGADYSMYLIVIIAFLGLILGALLLQAFSFWKW